MFGSDLLAQLIFIKLPLTVQFGAELPMCSACDVTATLHMHDLLLNSDIFNIIKV